MAIKAISQFDAATPTSNDKILFEQNGEGKSTALVNLPISTKTQTALNAKVDTANVLTLEEIQATTDLTGKIASASALKEINFKKYTASINRDYITGKVFAYSVNGVPRVIAQFKVTTTIPVWTPFIHGLPSIPFDNQFNIYDTQNEARFQYSTKGFIQSAQSVPTGNYTIIF